MTQDEFFREIARKSDVTISSIELVMSAFAETLQECVEKRETVTILNVGVLKFAKVKARKVKGNPNFLDGQDKEYPESEKVLFHLSKNLKSLLKK